MSKASHLFGASVILHKDGKILLQQRRDNKCWGYHGGRVELGEVVEEAAKRELLEETGLTAYSLKLYGVFSGPDFHHIYPDGNEFYIIDMVYICDDFSGEEVMQVEECLDLQWFDMDNIPRDISPTVLPVLRKFIEEYQGVGGE
ncbi:MAG: NUDIX domain-containing protein [Defluviitaleaceae bacterium]|nr:NUDIX domain-containing protein [Defluviitaleaceae bacterium]